MRKWVLYGIKPVVPVLDQPQSDGLSEALTWRIPSFLTGVLSWAVRSWKTPASLWARTTAVATAQDVSDTADGIQAGSAEEEESSHALIRGSSSGTPSSRAVSPDLLQQSFSSSSSSADRLISHDVNVDLTETQAVHAGASAPPTARFTPQRHSTWSSRSTEAFCPPADADEIEPAVTIPRSGDILVNPKQHLQRASTWPRASSTCPASPQPPTALLPSRSKPDLAISDNGEVIRTTPLSQDYLNHDPASSQAAGSVAEAGLAASDQQFHKTCVVKAGHVGGGDIEEVKGLVSPKAAGGGSPRIAAVQSHPLQLQEEEEEKPQWKVKANAKGTRVQQQNTKAGKCLPL